MSSLLIGVFWPTLWCVQSTVGIRERFWRRNDFFKVLPLKSPVETVAKIWHSQLNHFNEVSVLKITVLHWSKCNGVYTTYRGKTNGTNVVLFLFIGYNCSAGNVPTDWINHLFVLTVRTLVMNGLDSGQWAVTPKTPYSSPSPGCCSFKLIYQLIVYDLSQTSTERCSPVQLITWEFGTLVWQAVQWWVV